MALAKKCNRCGKYYDYYPKGAKVQHNGVARVTISGAGLIKANDDPMDLCEKCMSEFDKFMMSGGKFDDKT